jgi:type III restriction enzyme
MAAILVGKPDLSKLTQIELEKLGKGLRMQEILFRTAANIYDEIKPEWSGTREYLLAQVILLVEKFLQSDKILFHPLFFNQDKMRQIILLTVHMNKVVQHVFSAIRAQSYETLEPVFNSANPIRSTLDVRPWYTGRPCEWTQRSHINFCVYDSTWEATESYELDNNSNVVAWVKNDHLGFEIPYIFKGVIRKYRPDYIVKLKYNKRLVIEVKGQDSEENQAKWAALEEWIKAINYHGGFGQWVWDISWRPKDIVDIIIKYS